MNEISNELRLIVGENIRHCRERAFPGKGGKSKCAEIFGVSLQQWSPWELGKRLPKDGRLAKIADFFGKSVAWLRTRHNFDDDSDDDRDDNTHRLGIQIDGDDVARFFRRFEDVLGDNDRGDIVVSITIKSRKDREGKERESV